MSRRVNSAPWAWAAVFAVAVGCGDGPRADTTLLVDPRQGAIDGLRLGDSFRTVEDRFGPGRHGRGTNVRRAPLGTYGTELGLPWVMPPASARRLSLDRLTVLRYREMVFEAVDRRDVYRFSVSARGARTTEGVGIGDPLRSVSNGYRGVRCDVRNQGTEYEEYPYCIVRLGRERYLGFGQDPIRSITVSSTPLV